MQGSEVTAQRGKRPDRAPFLVDSPGVAERRIVAEVAVSLRISPRFSDDGAPEGTCDRALSIHLDEPQPDEEGEQEIDLREEFVRAFRDEGTH
jgi:hypothetical protein